MGGGRQARIYGLRFVLLPENSRQAPQADAMAAEKQRLAQELWTLEGQLRDAQRQVATRSRVMKGHMFGEVR